LRLGGPPVLKFFADNTWQNFHFAYINSKKNYCINQVDLLFSGQPTEMFVQNKIYTIHLYDQPCGQLSSSSNTSSLADSITLFLKSNYPKQKFLPLIFDNLLQKDLIDNDFYFKNHRHVHILDFIRFINNRFFDKNEKPNAPLQKLIKSLQIQNVRFPNACINNPIAKTYFC